MESAITKISQNGQIVIPSDIRKAAKIKPSDKFLIIEQKGIIMLKPLRSDYFGNDLALLESLAESEEDIRKGRVHRWDPKMSFEEYDRMIMSGKWKSLKQRNSGKISRKSRIKK